MESLLSVNKLSELTGLARQTIYNRRKEGDLPAITKIGSKIMFALSDVRAWLDAKKQRSCPATLAFTTCAPKRRRGRPGKVDVIASRKAAGNA